MTNITSGKGAQAERPTDRLMGCARILGVLQISPVTLWRWIRVGIFPEPSAYIAKRRYWRESVVNAWLEKKAPREPVNVASAVV